MTRQLLHLVIGGELKDPTSTEFVDLAKVDVVGLHPNYAEAGEGLAGQGAGHDRQRPRALFRRPSPSAADPVAPADPPV